MALTVLGVASFATLAEPRADHGEATRSWATLLPEGFPAPITPSGEPPTALLVELGRHLFFDRRLSGNGTSSCGTCHRQELAFTDGRARAVGSTGEEHPRSAMSLTNVAYNASLTWADPGVALLEEQAKIPLLNRAPVELGLAGREEEVLERFREDSWYSEGFARAFPNQASAVSLDTVTRALAAFQRTLISGGSPYDRRLFQDDREAMSPAARRGMRLFFSERLGCSGCHGGFNLSGPVRFSGGPPPEPAFHNTGLYNLGGKGLYPASDSGLRQRTGRLEDTGRFRAPTLRNIAVTAPYMHDGSIETLEEAIRHYAVGGRTISDGPDAGVGRDNPFKDEQLKGFEISPEEIRDVAAFLHSLTDEDFLSDPRFADPFRRAIPSGGRSVGAEASETRVDHLGG